jgi:hypothetical protein
MLLRALDLLTWPSVSSFIFSRVLNMRKSEMLRGAQLSALAVNDSIEAAVNGDRSSLDELHAAIDPELFELLVDEVRQGLERDAVPPMLAELSRQRQQIQGAPRLSTAALIVGAQRGQVGYDMHRLCIGSHLVVVGSTPVSDGRSLWSLDRQRDLLLQHGCTVHMSVAFTHPRCTGKPQLYTFEASVDGQALSGGEEGQASTSELQFSLADLNGMTKRDPFWEKAADVPWWPQA